MYLPTAVLPEPIGPTRNTLRLPSMVASEHTESACEARLPGRLCRTTGHGSVTSRLLSALRRFPALYRRGPNEPDYPPGRAIARAEKFASRFCAAASGARMGDAKNATRSACVYRPLSN